MPLQIVVGGQPGKRHPMRIGEDHANRLALKTLAQVLQHRQGGAGQRGVEVGIADIGKVNVVGRDMPRPGAPPRRQNRVTHLARLDGLPCQEPFPGPGQPAVISHLRPHTCSTRAWPDAVAGCAGGVRGHGVLRSVALPGISQRRAGVSGMRVGWWPRGDALLSSAAGPAQRGSHSRARRADAQIIVVCSEGYASTLAAATLRRIGLREATDLDGGFQAWKAGLGSSPGPRRHRAIPGRRGRPAGRVRRPRW